MFTDRAFAIDEASEEYRLLHPNAGALSPVGSAVAASIAQCVEVFFEL